MRSALRRRLFHLVAGLAIALAAWFLPGDRLLVWLGTVTLLYLAFEFTRLRVPRLNRWFFRYFGSLLREAEATRVTTSSYVLIAALISYRVFGRDIAVLCVSFLAVGDVAAGVVGCHMGRTRLFGKSLEGDVACFISCLATGFALCYAGLDVGPIAVLTGSLAATAGQGIPSPVDDNLTLPLLAGVAMAAVPP